MNNGIERSEKDPRRWLEQELGVLFLVMSESNFLWNIPLSLHIIGNCRTANEDRLPDFKTTISLPFGAGRKKDYAPWSPFRRELRLAEGQIPVDSIALTLLWRKVESLLKASTTRSGWETILRSALQILEQLTCHAATLGTGDSERWEFVRPSERFQVPANWKVRRPWGESWHCEAVAPRHFGSMYSALFIGLNQTVTALLLIAFVSYHGSIDYQLQMSMCSFSPRRSLCKVIM